MEMFSLPIREIQDRFTASEVVLLGWRSQEQAFQMRRRMHRTTESEFEDAPPKEGSKKKKAKKKEYHDASVPEGLPDRFYDEETGEVNLSKVSLSDAVKYMRMCGVDMPPPTNKLRAGRTRNVEKAPSMDDLF